MARSSIFEFAGGEDAFRALAAAHHARCLADPLLEHPFSHGISPDHVEHLGAYLAEVFGGPPRFSTAHGGHSAMLGVHANEEIGDEFGDRFVACFVAAADDAGLPDDQAFRAALAAYMRWAMDEVMTYSPPDARVRAGLPMPRWDWDGLVQPS